MNAQGKDRWLMLDSASSGSLTNKQNNLCEPRVAARLATMMLACYRSSEASDPETFVAAVAGILSRYPQDIASTAANPTVGLPSRSKWLPSVAEVRDECERLMAPAREEEARRLRQERAAAVLGGSDRRIDKANWDRLQAMYGSSSEEKPGQSAEEIAARHASPLKLSQAALDSFHRKTGGDDV